VAGCFGTESARLNSINVRHDRYARDCGGSASKLGIFAVSATLSWFQKKHERIDLALHTRH
jgi:hypothetical protein